MTRFFLSIGDQMTRVVICAQHGGFGLSPDAIAALALAGSPLITVKPWVEYSTAPYGQAFSSSYREAVNRPDGFSHDPFVKSVLWKDGNVYYVSREDKPAVRSHPDLLRLIDERGAEFVAGEHCTLKIVDVPDDARWHIEEYNGLEWVAEDHQTWG